MNKVSESTQLNAAYQADETIPVVIVGAGPTGLAVANLLGMAGIATLLIERNSGLSNIPKAIVLDDEGMRICQAAGFGAAMSSRIVSDIAIHCVAEERLLAKVVPGNKRNGHPLIATFYQPEFEAVLLDGLQRFPCVNVRFQHEVEAVGQSADCVVVSIRTPVGTLQKIRCTYLLACDGGRSIIRHSLNIPLQGMTFAQKWLVIDTIDTVAERDAPAVLKIFCDPQRPAVSIPTPHNGRRWEFMLLPGETEQEMLEPATISALLQQAGASPQTHITRQTVYTFHAAQAKTFSQGRVFLLGDAAHMMPPFGGQGLNSGLRDACNLAWKVAMVLQDRATPQLLATYHKERSKHAAQMVAFASFLGTIFMEMAGPLAFCRNLLIRMLSALPIVWKYVVEMRMKPQAKYKAGFFLFKSKGKDKKMVGSLLPQPEIIAQQGQHVLLDDVLGTGFSLLRCHSNPEEAFAKVKTDFWEGLGVRFVCIQTDDMPGASERIDTKGDTYRHDSHNDQPESRKSQPLSIVVVRSMDKDFLRICQDRFVVVRPDRFILGTFEEEKAASFVAAFQHLLCHCPG